MERKGEQSLVPEYAGWDKPPHKYAMSPDAPHFSQQDFNFKKAVCQTNSRRAQNAGNVSKRYTLDEQSSTQGSGHASSDARREAMLKWQAYNHRRQDESHMKELIQPGDTDDGDSVWGVIREDRHNHVPHWSQKLFDLKKRHHTAPIHKTPKNAYNPDLQSSSHLHFQDPRTVSRAVERDIASDGLIGTSHVHNSHAHLCLAMRRHDIDMGTNECDYRSCHPPIKSPEPHFYASPEPQHMACYLYPEGPSLTARHVPEHFVSNVVHSNHPFCRTGGHKKGSSTGSNGSKSARLYGQTVDKKEIYPDASTHVMDGTRQTPIADVVAPRDDWEARAISPYYDRLNSAASTSVASRYQRDPKPRSTDYYDFNHDPCKPPPSSTRAPEVGHVYRSHAQLQYDKRLCQASAFTGKVDAKWERTCAGSNGSISDGGSGAFESQERPRSRGGSVNRGRGERRIRSADAVQKRSRSTDEIQKSRRQPPRAASNDRFSRRSDTRRSDTRRRRSA